MTIQINIPEELDAATVRELDLAARQAVAVRLYQQGKWRHKQLAAFLGLDRWEAEELLHRLGVSDLTAAEVDRQFDAVRRMGV